MTSVPSDFVIVAAIAMLAWVVRVDFATLRISNRSVLILLGLYLLWAALTGFATIWTDLVSGAILFSLALVMWLWRMMGAGDVKLYAAIGMFVGIDHLLIYAVLLLAFSVLFVVVIQTFGRMTSEGRLQEIRKSGKAPYSVPMCLAAIPAMILRVFG